MSETINKPVFNIPEPPSFLVKEGKVYMITELNCDVSKAFKSIDKWYLHKLNEAIEPFIRQRSKQDQDDLEKQLAHISKHNLNNIVTVDSELTKIIQPLVCVAGKVYNARLIDYNPQKACFSWYHLNEYVSYIVRNTMPEERDNKYSNILAMWEDCGHTNSLDRYYDIELKQDLVRFPCLVTYANGISRIICTPKTYHTYNDSKLCTGDVSALTFWIQEDFVSNFNQINFSSVANMIVNWTSILQDKYIVSWKVREDTSWIA